MASLLDAPIPGQSLTDQPKNWPWENPPEMADPEEATKFYINKLANEEVMDDLANILDAGLTVSTLVKGMLSTGVMNGMHSIDVSIIIAPVLHSFIKAAMTSYGIEVKDTSVDPEEAMKDREKKRLQLAIDVAVSRAKEQGTAEGDAGVSMLEEIKQNLDAPTEEAVDEEQDMEVSTTQEESEPMGLMARGA